MKTKILTLLMISISFTYLNAQVLSMLDNYGSNDMERSHNIAIDTNGNVYVTGWFKSPSLTIGGITLVNSGGGATRDVFVAKFDPTGTPVWAISAYGPNADDFGNDIAVDDEFVYVTGSFEYDGIYFTSSSPLPNSGGSDFFVACFKQTSGSHVWSFTNDIIPANADLNEYGEAISIKDDHTLYFTGSFNSDQLICGTLPLVNTSPGTSTYDIFIGKVDVSIPSSYSIDWLYNPAGDGDDYGMDICNDNSGNVFVTGYFYSQQLLLGASSILFNTDITGATCDIYTAWFNSGACMWGHNPAGDGDDYSLGIETNGWELYITGGYKSTSLDFGGSTSAILNPATMFSDFFLTRYDIAMMSATWTKTADANITPQWNFDDYGKDLAIDVFGDVYLTGWYNSYKINFGSGEITNETNNNYSEIIIAKYGDDGTLHWIESAHGVYNDMGMGVDVHGSEGCCVFTGWYENNPLQFGSFSLPLANPEEISDFYVGRCCGYDSGSDCIYDSEDLLTGVAGIGASDPNWNIIVDPSGGTVPRPAVGCIWHTPSWSYGYPFAGTEWISLQEDPSAITGVYTFERLFTMTASGITPFMDLYILADDYVEVFLNGTSIGSGGGLYDPLNIYISGDAYFISGTNSLRVVVHNTVPSKMAFDLKGIVCYEDMTTGSEEKDIVSEETIMVYPNPAEDHVYFKADRNIESALIYSYTGQKVMEIEVNEGINRINTGSLQSGMYFIKFIKANGSMLNSRFIRK